MSELNKALDTMNLKLADAAPKLRAVEFEIEALPGWCVTRYRGDKEWWHGNRPLAEIYFRDGVGRVESSPTWYDTPQECAAAMIKWFREHGE